MNELEKALEQLNIKYETNGKQYKIPTTKENLVELLKAYITMTINLQSKIDKAIEFVEKESKICYTNKTTDDPQKVIGNFMWHTDKLLDILKEDK